ncbi:Mediator of RNA polymerase II transcription subunit 15a [Ananas comosus]|uniref:Mediator of RNA polymerase II transcription subunit 15a n=1 Tax=Ananas comosus TaxID=4615 RepID=A0A199VG66_ANACO|nr:Mediator of RNA polymerase II transcription subunit 15a [Ananas comosus]
MEGNSWRPAQGDPTTATSAAAAAGADPSAVDWRSQLQPEARQRIVNKIMETLKRHLPISVPEGLNELQKIAVRFEEKIYTAATCQADYLKKISLKMLSMESKTNPTPSNASQPQNPGDPALSIPPQVSNQPQSLAIPLINQSSVRQALLPQNLQNNTLAVPTASSNLSSGLLTMTGVGQPSTLQNMSGMSQNTASNSVGQVAPTDIYANTQRQMQASVESTAQTGPAGGIDWQEEIYQKIISMKELYFADLSELYQRIVMKLQQHDALMPPGKLSDQYENMKKFKVMLERTLAILNLNKGNIQSGLKDKLPLYEKQIVSILASHKKKPPQPQGPQQQFQHSHSMAQQQPAQVAPMPKLENQMNQLQQVNTMQQAGSASGLQHVSMPMPANFGVPNTQQNMTNSLQAVSNLDSIQSSSLSQLQQGPIGSLQHNSVGSMQNTINASQQHFSGSQRTGFGHQQLKPAPPFPISSPQNLQASSPQISHHSSPQIDQHNLLSSQIKAGTPLQSSNSPFAPSPSTPIAPSPVPGETEKQLPNVSSLPSGGQIGSQQANLPAPVQSLVVGTPGISASPLLAEFPRPDGNQANLPTLPPYKAGTTESPLDRLLKVVQSASPQALSSAVSDIGSVVSMIDRIAGSAPGNGSRAAVGEDLVAMTKCRLQARNFMSQDGNSTNKKMKRDTNAMPLNNVSSAGSVNDSFMQLYGLDASELQSTATSRVKKHKAEVNHVLAEEIREINQQLIDTVVNISEEDADSIAASSEGGDGTVIICSYTAVALCPSLKSQFASAQISPILPLRLLVPANYPKCSPVLLDKLPDEQSRESDDLSTKAKTKFNISLRGLSQPMSLREIAKTWDSCARKVIAEYAQQTGGGSFSSRFGAWENCVGA